MKIWVYTHCRNEKVIMPYFLRHYATFADRIIIYDDRSTDGTEEIIVKEGSKLSEGRGFPFIEIRQWPRQSRLDDKDFLEVIYSIYPEAAGRADWIMWMDADEFIYTSPGQIILDTFQSSPTLKEILDDVPLEVDVVRPSGWSMVHHTIPTSDGQITDEIKTGIPGDGVYDKPCIFRPDRTIRWNLGRHDYRDITKQTELRIPEIKLLHYRWLGPEYSKDRNAKNYMRLSDRARKARWGFTVFPDWHGDHSHEWVVRLLKEGNVKAVI